MRFPQRRILYCEDDPESRELIKFLFTRHGYDIVCAENGTTALQLAMREQFDLVLLDNEGTIRGQYVSDDREEMDRLITELSILLKKY